MASAKIAALGFQALATVILSRNLSSIDYGIMAFASLFIHFLWQFNDFGINSAALQATDFGDDTLFTAFWIKLALGVGLFTIAFTAAPIAAPLFGTTSVVTVVRVLSFAFILTPLSFVPTTLLTRALNYRTLAIIQASSTIASAGLSVALALSGFGYWSLVLSHLASLIATVILANVLCPRLLRLTFSVPVGRRLIQYGSGLFASSLMVFALLNADTFLIGSLRGAAPLGYYTLALNWGAMIAALMGGVVHTVLFPTFSRIQNDKPRLRRAYLQSMRYISGASVFANVTLAFIGPEFLFHVLGHGTDKWLPAQNALWILCVYGVARALLEPIGSVIMAVGRTPLIFKSCLATALAEVLLLYPGIVFLGIEGAAIAVTAAYGLQYLLYYPFLRHDLAIHWKDFLAVIAPAALPLLVITPLFAIFAYTALPSTLWSLILKGGVCAGCYAFSYGVATRWRLFQEIREIFAPSSNQPDMPRSSR